MITWFFTITLMLSTGPVHLDLDFPSAESCRFAQARVALHGVSFGWSKTICVQRMPK